MAQKPPRQHPATVLVYVGLDRIGDSLLKLPFVRGLRAAWPEARITWVAGKETSVYADIMAASVDGLLDEVIEHAGIGLSPWELLRQPLNGRRFDLIIDTQRIFWASLSLWRIPHRTFISPAGRFLLSSVKPPAGYKFPRSMQRQMLDLLELASGGAFPSPETLEFPLAPDFTDRAAHCLPEGPEYIGIAPGSGGAPKCWPRENFIALAKIQAAAGRAPVFILGPGEAGWMADLRAAVPEARFPLQETELAAEFPPALTIALAGRFRVGVANDSGAGHMFAVGGAPLVCLYGPTVAEKFRPMTRRLTVIKAIDFGGREMHHIPVDAVAAAIDEWAGRRPAEKN